MEKQTKKSHTFEVSGAHLGTPNFQAFMNLKNKYFVGLKFLHTSIFTIITSYYNIIFAISITLIIL